VKRIFALLIALGLPAPALANTNINAPVRAIVLPQGDSPVKITTCTAIANDFTYAGQYSYTQVHSELSFENVSKTTVSAVRFAFEVDDSFNHPYNTYYAAVTGSYAPGVLIEPHRAGLLNALQGDASAFNANVLGQDIGGVACYVQDVRFADGTVWTADIRAEMKAAGLLH
jgi:hypothetical protein